MADRQESDKVDKRLELLLDYTKFHIGIYVSIGTGLVTALAFDRAQHGRLLGCNAYWLFVAAILLQALAGLGGGLVCASLINYTSFEKFNRTKIGPLYPRCWEKIEHLAFWLSMAVAAIAGVLFVRSGTGCAQLCP